MGRRPIHSMKPRQGPILDHFVQASIDGGHVDGHYRELVYAGVEDLERAREIRRALFRSAKHLGYALKADVEPGADGTHAIRFHAIDKDVARAYITAKAQGDPSRLDYNPYGARSN